MINIAAWLLVAAMTQNPHAASQAEKLNVNGNDLNDRIHRFHQGASREIWKRYATDHLEPAIGAAVASGILRRNELPDELLRHVAGLIEFYEADDSGS